MHPEQARQQLGIFLMMPDLVVPDLQGRMRALQLPEEPHLIFTVAAAVAPEEIDDDLSRRVLRPVSLVARCLRGIFPGLAIPRLKQQQK